MNVLWLARTIPFPIDAGDRTYSVGLATALAPHVASLKYMAIGNSSSAEIARALVPSVDWTAIDTPLRSQLTSLLARRPYVSARHSPAHFIRAVKAELARTRYDAVVLDQYALGWALEELTARLNAMRPKLVYIAHNFERQLAADTAREFRGYLLKRALLRTNASKIARMEKDLVVQADLVTVISEADGCELARLGAARAPVILRPGAGITGPSPRQISGATPARMVMVGSFVWIPKQMNLIEFLEAADPVVAGTGLQLDIIGAAPTDLIESLSAKFSWIKFLGFVDDLDAVLANYRIGLNIERTGGGFKLKTLSYVAAGLPIAALSAALTGVPDPLQRQMLVRETPDELMHAVIAGINNVDELNLLASGARDRAIELFDWERTGNLFAAQLRQIILEGRAVNVHLPQRQRSGVRVVQPARTAN